MGALIVLASLLMLGGCNSEPAGYSYRTTHNNVKLQHVPSIAQLHVGADSNSNSQYSSEGIKASAQEAQRRDFKTSPQTHSKFYPSSYASLTFGGRPIPQPKASGSSYTSRYAAPTSFSSYASNSGLQPQKAPLVHQYSSASNSIHGAPNYEPITSPKGFQSTAATSHHQYPNSHRPHNVQVNYGTPPQLPPGAKYGPPPVVKGAGPEHANIEYRVVYVKGPKAPQPDVVLPPPPPKTKTIVYILVPRVQPPDPIIVPTHPPTPPPKPEVYFIRYKSPTKKPKTPRIVSNDLSGYASDSYGSGSDEYNEPVLSKSSAIKKRSSSESLEEVSSSQEVPFGSKLNTADYGIKAAKE